VFFEDIKNRLFFNTFHIIKKVKQSFTHSLSYQVEIKIRETGESFDVWRSELVEKVKEIIKE